jgi:hypothetical protein
MKEHDPEIVGYMIKYMYSGDYTIIKPDADAAKSPLESTENTPGSETKPSEPPNSALGFGLGATPTPSVDTSQELMKHTAVWLLGEEKDIPGLKDLAARKYANALPQGWNSEGFCKSLELIYKETPESDPKLWDIAIKFAGSKARELVDRDDFADLWEENGHLGLEVFRAFLSVTGATAPQKVQSCHTECPTGGARHAPNIVASRRKGKMYFCTVCRVPF